MKLKEQETNQFSTSLQKGDNFEIAKETQGQIIEFLSSNIYKDPIGTIIREYASNAWDANVEAGLNEPIVVEINEDASGLYCSIVDFGVGISEKRVSEVFTKYGKSTKNESNSEIGGFGIGGKSAFSYTDSFLVNTIFDEHYYNYIVTKTDDAPQMFLLNKTEINDGKSGTEIKIYLKQDHDKQIFFKKAKQQLVNFENVIIKYFDEEIHINKKGVFETETFIVNPKYSEYFDSNFYAVIGPVTYPLSLPYEKKRMSSRPIGIKFEIGDVDVTLSREELRMNEKTERVIEEKFDKVISELEELYLKQKKICIGFKEFYNRKRNPERLYFTKELFTDLRTPRISVSNLRLAGFPVDMNIPTSMFFIETILRYSKNKSKFLTKGLNDFSYGTLLSEDNKVFFTRDNKSVKRKILYYLSTTKEEKNIFVVRYKKPNYYSYKNKIRKYHLIQEEVNFTKRILLFKQKFEDKIISEIDFLDDIVIPKGFFSNSIQSNRTRIKGLSFYKLDESFGNSYRKMTLDSNENLIHNTSKKSFGKNYTIVYTEEDSDIENKNRIETCVKNLPIFKGKEFILLKPVCSSGINHLKNRENAYSFKQIDEMSNVLKKIVSRYYDLKTFLNGVGFSKVAKLIYSYNVNKTFTETYKKYIKLSEKYISNLLWDERSNMSRLCDVFSQEEIKYEKDYNIKMMEDLISKYENIYKEIPFFNIPENSILFEESVRDKFKEYFRTRNFRL